MIKITHVREELVKGKWLEYDRMEDEITFERFYSSFVDEKWEGEERYDFEHTPYGYFHTTTIVRNPYDNTRSVRYFEFE